MVKASWRQCLFRSPFTEAKLECLRKPRLPSLQARASSRQSTEVSLGGSEKNTMLEYSLDWEWIIFLFIGSRLSFAHLHVLRSGLEVKALSTFVSRSSSGFSGSQKEAVRSSGPNEDLIKVQRSQNGVVRCSGHIRSRGWRIRFLA